MGRAKVDCPTCGRPVVPQRVTEPPRRDRFVVRWQFPLHGPLGNRCAASGHIVKETP